MAGDHDNMAFDWRAIKVVKLRGKKQGHVLPCLAWIVLDLLLIIIGKEFFAINELFEKNIKSNSQNRDVRNFYIYMEILAHSSYSELNYPISYWRTASGFEVDFVLGDHELVVEVKPASMVGNRHLKGIRAFKEEYAARHYIVISMDPKPRKTTDGIDILPWNLFLERLWEGSIFHKN